MTWNSHLFCVLSLKTAISQLSDTPDKGKDELSPKNIMKQMYKFYKEHLHPIEPPPSFRLVLMWALQTGQYSINWNFYFGKQISFAAAEATWAMMLNANKAKDWDIVKAALVDVGERAQERHVPADWCADNYEEDEFESLSMKAAGERDAANDARLDRMADVETPAADAAAAAAAAPVTPEERLRAYFRRMDSHQQPLRFSDGSESHGLPVYAEAAAAEMANRSRSQSVDSSVSVTESELNREAQRKRMRYVDDEAEESDN